MHSKLPREHPDHRPICPRRYRGAQLISNISALVHHPWTQMTHETRTVAGWGIILSLVAWAWMYSRSKRGIAAASFFALSILFGAASILRRPSSSARSPHHVLLGDDCRRPSPLGGPIRIRGHRQGAHLTRALRQRQVPPCASLPTPFSLRLLKGLTLCPWIARRCPSALVERSRATRDLEHPPRARRRRQRNHRDGVGRGRAGDGASRGVAGGQGPDCRASH